MLCLHRDYPGTNKKSPDTIQASGKGSKLNILKLTFCSQQHMIITAKQADEIALGKTKTPESGPDFQGFSIPFM